MSNDDSTVHLNLHENACDFIGESLRYAQLASEDPSKWKFAIILGAQGIELLLKARLAIEHPLLILVNPDKAGSSLTVGVDSALMRLAAAGVEIDESDQQRFRRAHRLRNSFMHFEVDAPVRQLEAAYADLFEFAHFFQFGELSGELHSHIAEEFYAVEAVTMEQFQKDTVVYQGSEVVKYFPSEIVDAQFAPRLLIGGVSYPRIRRGAADDLQGTTNGPCGDCSVLAGQLHVFYCDLERCPKCREQLLGCGCHWEPEYIEEIASFIAAD
jgi:hypothetical protein